MERVVFLVLKKSIFGGFWCVALRYISIILSFPPVFEETSTIYRNSESESPALDRKKCRKEKGATKQDEESEVSVGGGKGG